MKYLVTADLHFGNRDKFAQEAIDTAWGMIVRAAIDTHAHAILIAGDIFDSANIGGRESSTGSLVRRFLDIAQCYLDKSGTILCLKGNHDDAGPSQGDALEVLDRRPGFIVARRPEVIDIGDLRVACLPWLTKAHMLRDRTIAPGDSDRVFRERVGEIVAMLGAKLAGRPGPSLLLGHTEVAGSVTAQGFMLGGGSYEFSAGELDVTQADCIVLGHYHKRQGHYVGSPAQCNWGEAGNPTGYLLLETSGSPLELKAQFVELDVPRYVVLRPEEYVPARVRPQDRVRILGSENDLHDEALPLFRPEILENVTFAPVKQKTDVQARIEGISPEDAPTSLLEKWTSVNPQPIPIGELRQALDELLPGLPAKSNGAGAGSLSRVREVKLRGFGPHQDTHVQYPDGVLGVCGANGAGKTFLIEALPAIVFGEFPSRSGSLYDAMTQAGTGEAVIEVLFDSGDTTYRAMRHLKNRGKTKSQECYLYRVHGKGDEAMAGPKEGDFSARVAELIGDKAIFLASAFSSQGGAGDIVSLDPGPRQALFAKWLGLERFEAMSTAAGDHLKKMVGRADAEERQLLDLKAAVNELPAAELDLGELERARTDASISVDELSAEELQALAAVQAAKEAEQQRTGLQEQKAMLLNDIEAIDAAVRDIGERMERGRALIARSREIEKQAAQLASLRKQKEVHLAAAGALEALNAERAGLVNKKQGLENRLKDMRQQRLDGVRKQISNAKAQLSDASSTRIRLEGEVKRHAQRLESERAAVLKDITQAEKRTALLEQAGCRDNPLPCPLISDAQAARSSIEALREQADEIALHLMEEDFAQAERRQVDAITERIRGLQEDLISYNHREEEEVAGRLDGEVEHDIQDEIVTLEEVLEHSNEELRKKQAVLPRLPAEQEIQRLEAAEKDLKEIERYRERLASLEEQLAAKSAEREAKQGALVTLEVRITTLGPVQNADEERLGRVRDSLRCAREKLRSLDGVIGVATAQLMELRKKQGQVDALEANLAGSRRRRQTYQILEGAFGRRGIPQLLIDAARPQIQDILDTLLEGLPFTVSFDTQRTLKDGRQKETLDIIVSDDQGERDIRRFSGGEQKLLRSLVRIGLGLFQASRHGRRIQVFTADEAFDALDRDNSLLLLSCLAKLKDRFNQVVIVSHSDELLIDLPARVVVEKNNGISKAEVIT